MIVNYQWNQITKGTYELDPFPNLHKIIAIVFSDMNIEMENNGSWCWSTAEMRCMGTAELYVRADLQIGVIYFQINLAKFAC